MTTAILTTALMTTAILTTAILTTAISTQQLIKACCLGQEGLGSSVKVSWPSPMPTSIGLPGTHILPSPCT
eukprot:6491012-Amphidinium_carterae.1